MVFTAPFRFKVLSPATSADLVEVVRGRSPTASNPIIAVDDPVAEAVRNRKPPHQGADPGNK